MNELEELIAGQIRAGGPITFCEFMRLALYHPQYGYYNRHFRVGKAGGDFFTNADIHPLFGAVLAQVVASYLKELGPGIPKTVVEYGAGSGRLALDLLSALETEHPAVFEHLEYLIVEQSPSAVAQQQAALSRFPQVCWTSLAELALRPIAGVILSNELVDAFPVHRVRDEGGGLQEQFITVEGDRFVPFWQAPSTPELAAYVEWQQISLAQQVCEVNLAALDWLGAVARAFTRGVLITIDYGDTADRLYRKSGPRGTLRCYAAHTLTYDPFVNVGRQDITTSVNFTALIAHGDRVGLAAEELMRQTDWLMHHGLVERAARLEQSETDVVTVLRSRQAVKQFLLPGGISDNFKVLVQHKAVNP